MPKTKISEFSATPGNNTDIDGINIAEGCSPSGINDAIRELMAQLKDFQAGTAGDSFNGPIGSTTPAAGAFTTLSASGTTTLSGLTASTALALDASKNVISVTNTGTGNNVLSASPTFTGTVNAAALTLSGSQTLSAGTANGVAYLNGSKVLTTGSALVFDGSNLGLGVTPSASWSVFARAMEVYAAGGAPFRGALSSTHSFPIGLSVNAVATSDGWAANYIATGSASAYFQRLGQHQWYTAPSGTAGTSIAWTQTMMLDASGNLGLGTTSIAYATGGRVEFDINGSSSSGIALKAGNTVYGYLGGSASGLEINSPGALPIQLFANGAERARITSGGNLLVGTTSNNASGGVIQVSNGITFPATQSASSDANTLDDYEQGTWTPTIVGTTTAGAGTYVVQTGRYTKIGNMVTATAYIEWSAHTGTGNMQLGGLPFATLSAGTNFGGLAIGYAHNIALTANNVLTAYTLTNDTKCDVYQYPVGGGASTPVPIDTAGALSYTATYLTAN